MKLIDNAAYVVASRHTGKNCVTASIDRLDFHWPVFLGNLVMLRASIYREGRTSMEVGAEDLLTGEVRHTYGSEIPFSIPGNKAAGRSGLLSKPLPFTRSILPTILLVRMQALP